jgi:septum formation protein
MNQPHNSPLIKLPKPLVLASSSPRRAELLRLINLPFTVCPSSISENSVGHLRPDQQAIDLAKRKAQAVASVFTWGIVIGADTIVEMGGEIFGKPADAAQAREMLRRLSGRTHTVYTGVVIMDCPTGRMASDVARTAVTFRPLDENEIAAYVASGSPLDKAGAYGIQDLSAVFAEKIDGCFYNVVGFPLTKFYLMLREFIARPATNENAGSTLQTAVT